MEHGLAIEGAQNRAVCVSHAANTKVWRCEMGGRGSSGYSLTKEHKRLIKHEAEAKQELELAKAARRNLFISFAAEDIDEANLLRGQAKNEKSEIDFIERSVRVPYDSTRADYIRQRISERIKQSSMTVVLVTENTASNRWVKWEIERSLQLGKKVVAFHIGKTPPAKLPSAIRENGIKVVPWSNLKDEIVPD
jgi:hypothetical protein